MTQETVNFVAYSKGDVEVLFKMLGLHQADETAILEGWRQAAIAWRQERQNRVGAHAERVAAHLRRFRRSALASPHARHRRGPTLPGLVR